MIQNFLCTSRDTFEQDYYVIDDDELIFNEIGDTSTMFDNKVYKSIDSDVFHHTSRFNYDSKKNYQNKYFQNNLSS